MVATRFLVALIFICGIFYGAAVFGRDQATSFERAKRDLAFAACLFAPRRGDSAGTEPQTETHGRAQTENGALRACMADRGYLLEDKGTGACNDAKYEVLPLAPVACYWHPDTGWLDLLHDDLHDEALVFK